MSASTMFERRWHALVTGVVLLSSATVLTLVVAADPAASAVQGLDDAWLDWITDQRSRGWTALARTMSVLGGPWVMVPVRFAVFAALAWRRRWLQLAAIVGATVSSELCIGPLKALIDRPRPPDPMIAVESASFPSGHAIAASVTAIGLVVVLVPVAGRRTRWTIVAAAFAAVMAMSRTYLGAHWSSDVIAGTCIGTGFAVVWPAALELLRARWQATSERRRRRPDVGRGVGTGLVLAGVAIVVALHVVRPDRSPRQHRLSEYAIGRFGPLMTVAFVAVGTGLLTLAAVGWRRRGGGSGLPALGVATAGVGLIASGIWPIGPDGSTTDAVHSWASASATVALVATACAWSVRRPMRARRAGLATTLAVLAAAASVLAPVLHDTAWSGLGQRLLWVMLLAWVLVSGVTSPAAADVSVVSAPLVTIEA